jgi:hypothetical protein
MGFNKSSPYELSGQEINIEYKGLADISTI